MRAGWLLAPLALWLAGPAGADEPMAWPAGLYSDVRVSQETGDLGGFEARFYDDAGRHMVEFVLCEGWCNETHVAEVRRSAAGFVFAFNETFTGAQGETAVEIRFVVRPVGKALTYSVEQGGENIDPNGKPRRLRRVAKAFGLTVAKSGKD